MAKIDELLKRQYACLDCYAKFPFGDAYLSKTSPDIACPKCRGSNCIQADGGVTIIDGPQPEEAG